MFNTVSQKRIDMTINSLYTELKEEKIILNPIYQRGKVWNVEEKKSFIDSICMDILPIPVIFNNDYSSGLYTCMDGLQRITSIYEFMSNKYYIIVNNKKVYYSKVPKRKYNNSKYRKLSDNERNRFNSKTLSVIVYENLTLHQQFDIFMRINEGKKLSDVDIERIIKRIASEEPEPEPETEPESESEPEPESEPELEPEEQLAILNRKIKSYPISKSTAESLPYVIFATNKVGYNPLSIPRTIRSKNKYRRDLSQEVEINIKNKIVNLFEKKIFDFNPIGKNIILGVLYFIESDNMYEHKNLKTIVNTINERNVIDNNPSYETLLSVYKDCKRLYRRYKQNEIYDDDDTDTSDSD